MQDIYIARRIASANDPLSDPSIRVVRAHLHLYEGAKIMVSFSSPYCVVLERAFLPV